MTHENDNPQVPPEPAPQAPDPETTTNVNAGTNLPDRNPQILEEGNRLGDLEKRNK